MAFELDLELSDAVRQEMNRELEAREALESVRQAYTRVTRTSLRYRLVLSYTSASRALVVVEESLTPLTRDGEPHPTVTPFIRFDPGERRASVKLEKQAHPRYFSFPRERTLLSEIGDLVNHPHLVAVARELASLRVYYVEPTRMRTEVGDVEASDPGPHGESLASFYHWLSRTEPVLFKNLKINLARFVPGFEDLEVREAAEGFLELWIKEVGNRAFHAALVSEGTLRLLCLLGIAATPRPPAIVGYEEPENGVHPGRLREMASIIEGAAERGPQFFLTTHSPDVIDLLEGAVRIHCRSTQGGSVFERDRSAPLFRRASAEHVLAAPETTLGTRLTRGDLG
jgi:predicted ATPase